MRIESATRLRDVLKACSRKGRVEEFLSRLEPRLAPFLRDDWPLWARDDQLAPPDDPVWTTWLVLGGRGAGKTRTGAEWIRERAQRAGERIALVGGTLGDVRSVMIEGVSGLMAVHGPEGRPRFEPSKRQLVWPNGSVGQICSAEEPDGLRGPQFSAAWCDEACKWRHAAETWDMLQFALRAGDRPQQVVTTTPRPIPLLKRIMEDAATVVTRARTRDNAANLAPAFLATVTARYGGTRLGRQELDGEILEDRPDALWPRALIEQCRVSHAPELERVVVGVDPPVTSGGRSSACGIVIAGRSADGRGYVLGDATLEQAGPGTWAAAVAAAFRRYAADRVVAEVNQGGDLVEMILRQAGPALPVRKVRATRGKWLRAEPVAALYERGQVSHVGAFPELEDQMVDFGHDGFRGSPDRLDALVWALTDLMLGRAGDPRVRSL